jgi:hypothetical protein
MERYAQRAIRWVGIDSVHARLPREGRVVNSVLLLAIGALSPWTVHLAPPKQRPLALVGVVAVFLLYGIFAENPLPQWEMWAGLVVGVISVMFLAGAIPGGGRGGRPHRSGGSRSRRHGVSSQDDDAGQTGEIR